MSNSSHKYHISPSTGRPNICRAKQTCPYGDLQTDHYASKEEAREAYEASMKDSTFSDGQSRFLHTPARTFEELTAAKDEAWGNIKKEEIRKEKLEQKLTAFQHYYWRAEEQGDATATQSWQEMITRHEEKIKLSEGQIDDLKAIHSIIASETATERTNRIARSKKRKTVEKKEWVSQQQMPTAVHALKKELGENLIDYVEKEEGVYQAQLTMEADLPLLKSQLEREGLLVTEGPIRSGKQLVRVRGLPFDPMPTNKFNWHATERTFTVPVSELNGKFPQFIKSVRTGKIIEMQPPVPHYAEDDPREITHWVSRPYDARENWDMEIYNT